MAICVLKAMNSAMLAYWVQKTMMLVVIRTASLERIRGPFAGEAFEIILIRSILKIKLITVTKIHHVAKTASLCPVE